MSRLHRDLWLLRKCPLSDIWNQNGQETAHWKIAFAVSISETKNMLYLYYLLVMNQRVGTPVDSSCPAAGQQC